MKRGEKKGWFTEFKSFAIVHVNGFHCYSGLRMALISVDIISEVYCIVVHNGVKIQIKMELLTFSAAWQIDRRRRPNLRNFIVFYHIKRIFYRIAICVCRCCCRKRNFRSAFAISSSFNSECTLLRLRSTFKNARMYFVNNVTFESSFIVMDHHLRGQL